MLPLIRKPSAAPNGESVGGSGFEGFEEFERLVADFLAAFERGTVQIGLDLLARYDHVLYGPG